MTDLKCAKPLPDAFEDAWDEHEIGLRLLKRADRTFELHRVGFQRFVAFLVANFPRVRTMSDVTRKHVEAWVAHMIEQDVDHQSMCIYIRTCRPVFTGWAEEHLGDKLRNPFRGAKLPAEPDRPVPVQGSKEALRAMLEACRPVSSATGWRRWVPIRDAAMIRTFYDLGSRLGEMAGMERDHWNSQVNLMHVATSKTYSRDLVVSDRTALAIRRYLRATEYLELTHNGLWVGRKGNRLTRNGIYLAVKRLAREAEVDIRVFPQKIRHLTAHESLVNGMEEGDVERKMGWNSRAMLGRYAKSMADERSRVAQRAQQLGNNL